MGRLPGSSVGRVYPRVCGGTNQQPGAFVRLKGLSPRVRGNPIPVPSVAHAVGSIPACAGEPAGMVSANATVAVYPRVCGGTTRNGFSARPPEGLSPRVRGNRAAAAESRAAEGSIPACAGEPYVAVQGRHSDRVYPRVCGGTVNPRRGPFARQGLSPRVRGNPGIPIRRPMSRRSIPACAGEPVLVSISRSRHTVYPRVCGGTWTTKASAAPAGGLSPRVRGNLSVLRENFVRQGSIPACAGEPACRIRRSPA